MVAITDKVTIEARFEGQNLRQGLNQALREMKRFEDAIEKVEKENKGLRIELDRVQKELKQTAVAAKGAGTAMGGMGKMAGTVKTALAGLAVYMSAGALKEYGDEWTNLRNRVKLFTKDQEETNRVVEELFQTSNRTRQSVSATAEVYQRFAMANKALNLSQNQLQKLLLTINQTVALSGVSGQAASAALVQLGQGMAAGVLRGEELNSVIEQTPRLAIAIAEGMGKTTGDLKAMGEAGQITAQQVVNSLFKEAARVETEFEKLTPTIDQSLVVLNNSFGQFIDQLEQQYSIFEKIASGIGALGVAMGEGSMSERMTGYVAEKTTDFFSQMYEDMKPTNIFEGFYTAASEVSQQMLYAGSDFSSGVLRLGLQSLEQDFGLKKESAFSASRWIDELQFGSSRTIPAVTAQGAAAIYGGGGAVDSFDIPPNTRLSHSAMIARLQQRPQGAAQFDAFMAGGGDQVMRGALPESAQNKIDEMDRAFGDLLDKQQDAEDKATAEAIAKEKAAQEQLANMRISLIDDEMSAFKAQQELDRQHFQERFGDNQELMESFDKLQDAQEGAQRSALELADNMQTLQTVTGAVVGLLNQMGKTELAGLVGAGGGFAMTMMDPTATPIQKVVSGINLATEAFSFLAPEVDDTAAAEREYQQALRQTRMEIQNNVEGLLGSNKIFRDAQRDATKFIREDFEAFMPKGDTWKRLRDFLGEIGRDAQNLEEDYGATAGGMIEAISDSMKMIRIHEGDDGGKYADELHAFEVSLLRWRELAELFGEDTGITDIYNEALRMEDGFNTLSRSMKRTTEELAPLTRSIRMGFDVEEMKMRGAAQRAMSFAGADPYLQNRVFRDLSRSIDRLRSRESAELRAIRTGTGAAKVTVGSGGGGGTTSGGTTTTTTTGAGPLVPEIRIQEIHLDEWADAVDVSNAEPINKNWNEIVPLIGSGTGHKRIDPVKWWNVVELKTMDTKTGRINKEWNEIVPLIGSGTGHKRIDPEFWYNVVELKTMDTRVGRIQKTWNEIIPMIGAVPGAKEKRINPGDWDVVIEVSDLNKNPIERNWHQVVQMGAKINVNRWSDVFTFGQMVQGGGTAPMARMSLGWGDIFNLDNMGTIDLDVGAAVRLVGERAKINISDLIDMSELDGVITNAVNRGLRDRSVTVNQGGANSSSGTATTRSQFYNQPTQSRGGGMTRSYSGGGGSPMGGGH